jgi:SAM-dependent methyltransferase
LAEFRGAEFTGERVIPELVEADLLNEHFARYRFAGRFISAAGSPGRRILDAGCGSGYGTAELSSGAAGAMAIGADVSAEAVSHARQRYGTGALFLQAACEASPFSDASFDFVVAFEVIEHLERWRELLAEARRVLKPTGSLLISTPNRDYYAESRGASGPNPFHRHEFDYGEFRDALGRVFPHVRIWTQNHAEAIVFAPADEGENLEAGALESSGAGDPAGAHFYLAVCSQSPVESREVFAWLPSTANVLKERESHIAKLESELAKKDAWLRQTIGEHSELQIKHEVLTAELERQNRWAAELDGEVTARGARIVELQKELDTRLSWVGDLESQIKTAGNHIAGLSEEIVKVRHDATTEIERLQTEAAGLEATVTERTVWAQRLDLEVNAQRDELNRIRSSKWFRAGNKLGLIPGAAEEQ